MHILVTNDDGPPSPTSSPYVHSLVRELQKADHTVSVCLPDSQRSWIGKAHIIGQTVKPSYYRPSETFDPSPTDSSSAQGSTHPRPRTDGGEEWVLVDGTPASCAQIGLHHFFQQRGPIDLVVSGPNYGRNTTAVFALSSGTLGGALEAAVCGKKSIALSYAFSSRKHDPVIIDAASKHSVRVIEKLYAQWPEDRTVDLYSVNVPLEEGVENRKTLFTAMLQNYWSEGGTCFEEVEGSIGGEEEEEEIIRESEASAAQGEGVQQNGPSTGSGKKGLAHRHFKWKPSFTDVYKSVEQSAPGNDGWAVKEGLTSVTPMKANFWHTATDLHGTELKLDNTRSEETKSVKSATSTEPKGMHQPIDHFYALIAYEDPYVQPLIVAALQKVCPDENYTLLSPPPSTGSDEIDLNKLLPSSEHPILQITPYEAIDWEFAAEHPQSCVVNSYMLRKALIRKHYLSATVEHWVAKRPQSVLKTHVKRSEAFEVDYAEFLDDALVEAFDLRSSLEKNETLCKEVEEGGGGQGEDRKQMEWWILKPSMSDRGQGIRLFSTMEQLQGIFDGWEAELPDSEDEDEEDGDGDGDANDDGDYITASHLRHFVAQPYIHPPLLLPGDNRKFHIRTYVCCMGALDVYVYREMLALFAGKDYVAPGSSSSTSHPTDSPSQDDPLDLEAHLTNTCLQRSVSDGTVRRFWTLDSLPDATKEYVFAQICDAAGEVFEAAARGMPMHFRPLGNAFEIFGLDFLVGADGTAWLLEVNAFPDFKQTGDELRDVVVRGLWEEVLEGALGRLFGVGSGGPDGGSVEDGNGDKGAAERRLVHVRRVDLRP